MLLTSPDDIIELANHLTEVEFSDFDQAYVVLAARVGSFVTIVGNFPPQEFISGRDLSIKSLVASCIESVHEGKLRPIPFCVYVSLVSLIVFLSSSFI